MAVREDPESFEKPVIVRWHSGRWMWRGPRYLSDVTDEKRTLVGPLIPLAEGDGGVEPDGKAV